MGDRARETALLPPPSPSSVGVSRNSDTGLGRARGWAQALAKPLAFEEIRRSLHALRTRLIALLLTTFMVAAIAQGCGGSDTVKPKDARRGQRYAGQGGAGTSARAAPAWPPAGAAPARPPARAAPARSGRGLAPAPPVRTAARTAGTIRAAAGWTTAVDAPADVPITMPSQAVSWLFDTSIEGWHFTKYGSTPDANAANNLAFTSTLAWDGTNDADNKTTSGSLKGTVPSTRPSSDRIRLPGLLGGDGHGTIGQNYKISAKVKLALGRQRQPPDARSRRGSMSRRRPTTTRATRACR